MIRVKDNSVQISQLTSGALLGLLIADQVFSERGYETVVTSGNDARHSTTSLHYSNNAVDLRSKHIPSQEREKIREEISWRLGLDWDVVLEKDHFHLECQPRGRTS